MHTDLIPIIRKLFINREDAYALQQKSGHYIKYDGYITDELIEKHLNGEVTLGVYTTNKDDKVKWACIDIDKNPDEIAKKLIDFVKPRKIGRGAMLEHSGGRGYHLYFFFKDAIPAAAARRFALEIIRRAGVDSKDMPEVFPKQNSIRGKYGNLVKLPFGKHQKYGGWSEIIYPSTVFEIEPIELPEEIIHELILLEESESFKFKGKVQERYWWNKCPVIKLIRDKGVPEGHRDEAAFLLARVYWEMGLTSEEAYILLRHWDETKNTPPLGENIIKVKVKQAYSGRYSVGFKSIINNSVLNQYCPPNCNICFYRRRKKAEEILDRARKKIEGVYVYDR